MHENVGACFMCACVRNVSKWVSLYMLELRRCVLYVYMCA